MATDEGARQVIPARLWKIMTMTQENKMPVGNAQLEAWSDGIVGLGLLCLGLAHHVYQLLHAGR